MCHFYTKQLINVFNQNIIKYNIQKNCEFFTYFLRDWVILKNSFFWCYVIVDWDSGRAKVFTHE